MRSVVNTSSWKVDSGTIRWDFWSVWKGCHFFWGTKCFFRDTKIFFGKHKYLVGQNPRTSHKLTKHNSKHFEKKKKNKKKQKIFLILFIYLLFFLFERYCEGEKDLSFCWFVFSIDSLRIPNVHIWGSRPTITPPKFHETTSPREEERMKIVAGEEKRAKFWALPPFGPPTLRGPSAEPPSAGQPSLFLGCCLCYFALDSAACAFLVACVPVAACACCCFWAARRPPLSLSPLPPLQCLTFQNVNNNFLQPIETTFAGIPPNFHGKTLLLTPSLSPTTFRGHTPRPQLFWVWHPCIRASLLRCLLCVCRFWPSKKVCTACVTFCAVFASFCCCLMLAFLVVCCFSCCSCCFCCRFCGFLFVVYGVAFVVAGSCCCCYCLCNCLCGCFCCLCCFVAVAGAFRLPTVEKPIFASLLTFQNVFAAYSVVCAAVLLLFLFVLLFVQLAAACAACCCLCGLLLLLLFLFLRALFRFFCCLSCFCCRFLGRRPLKNPPLPLLTFQNVKNKFTID